MNKTMMNIERQHTVDGADRCISERKAAVAAAPYRQKYHLQVPFGWFNDPNGFTYWNEEYHLFYQLYPFEPGPADFRMFWGHAISKDLVHWEHVKTALAPDSPFDAGGCWSGNAFTTEEGNMGLIYTGINLENKDQMQCYAESTDGIHFVKDPENPLLTSTLCGASNEDFRDPQIWKHGDFWYMIAGSTENGFGCVLLYRSADRRNWTFVNKLVESRGELGSCCECPNFFELDGRHVLLFSPHGLQHRKSVYLIGDFDYNSGRFFWDSYGEIDWGMDYYAPQTMLDDKGRRIIIGWAETWTWMPWFKAYDTRELGYVGAMSLPRELAIVNNRLQSRPVRELAGCRTEGRNWENRIVSPEDPLRYQAGDGKHCEIYAEIDLTECSAKQIQFVFRSKGEKYIAAVCDLEKGDLVFDRTHSDSSSKAERRCPLVSVRDQVLTMHFFLDTTSLEMFTDNYCTCQTNNFLLPEECTDMYISVPNGTCKVLKLETWGIQI